MCDCIQKIIEKTEAREYAVQAMVGSFDNQSSPVRYRPITLAGNPHKHTRGYSVPWEYCPFCGVKIQQN